MHMDIPERLERVTCLEIDGKLWIRSKDYLRAIYAPPKRSITAKTPRSEKLYRIEDRERRYMAKKVLYLSPRAAVQIAIDHARCPTGWIREWIAQKQRSGIAAE